MALKAGRVGLNKDLVDEFGYLKEDVPTGEYYTKTQADNKFETKTHVNNNFQKKTLEVPLEMLSGTKLTVEDALHGLNEEKFERAEQRILGAKNLLEFPYLQGTVTLHGVTFTDNGDGSITVSGTNDGTENSNYTIVNQSNSRFWNGIKNIPMIMSGGISTRIELLYWSAVDGTKHDRGSGVELTVSDSALSGNRNIAISIAKNTAITNPITIRPMLRLASDPDDTYVPYAMTNRELTDRFAILKFTTDATATDNSLAYPDGFTNDNCYVFLFMVKDGSGYWREGIGTMNTGERVFCVLKPDEITVSILTAEYKSKDMKILLMKI